MAARKGDGGETKRKWEKEENQDSEKWQSERRSCLEGSQTPVLQPENRPVWLSLLVLYSSTRPGRRFIVAITQIPLAFIPSLDASGLYSITVSIYRWKKKKSSTQEKCQGLKSPFLTNTRITQKPSNTAQLLFSCFFHAESKLETWSVKCSTRGRNPVPVALAPSLRADLRNGWTFVSVWYWVIQPLFCILMTRDVDVCVTVIFDPEGECCRSQRSAAFHWACSVFSDHTVKEPGPWDPKSLDIRGLWDATSHTNTHTHPHPHLCPLLQGSLRPIVTRQLTEMHQ